MHRLWKYGFWAVGFLILFGCGGGSAPPPPATPTITARIQTDAMDFDKVSISWVCSEPADGFQLEYSIDGNAFRPMTQDLIPKEVNMVLLTFEPLVPERITFGFRVSAMKNGSVIAHSVVSHRRTLRPALSPTLEIDSESISALIRWQKNPNSVATGFRLERKDEQGGWNAVSSEVTFKEPWFECRDFALQEGHSFTYRILPMFEAEQGMPVELNLAVPMKAPDQLVATSSSDGVSVAWMNRSRTATGVSVFRASLASIEAAWSDPVLVGSLPSTATSYFDPAPPSGCRLAYQVVATRSGSEPAPSTWCLLGGENVLGELGMGRTVVSLPFRPLARDLDGAWLGHRTLWGYSRTCMWIDRFPTAIGFPLEVPLAFGALDYPTHTVSSRMGTDGVIDIRVTESKGSFGAENTHVFRRANGVWQGRSCHLDSGVSLLSGFFSPEGVFQSFYYDLDSRAGLFRLDRDGSFSMQTIPDLPLGEKWGPHPTPSGEWLALLQDEQGWHLGIRAVSGLWTYRNIPELDLTTFPTYSCRGVQVDGNGVLHALFANHQTNGFRVDYLTISSASPARLQTVYEGVSASSWGRVGALAVMPDGSKSGFAIMDDTGFLQVGIREGIGSWNLKTVAVMDARVNWIQPFLMCGFNPQGRFWVAHDEVAHPARVGSEQYFEVLEQPVSAP